MEHIYKSFEAIEDPRHQSYIRHSLTDILILVTGAVICGITELSDIMGIMRFRSENIGEIFAVDGKAIRSAGENGKSHSFLQILTVYATESGITMAQKSISWLNNLELWVGLKTIFSIERVITAKGKTTKETEYYISSLPCDLEKLMKIAREHWKIESMHWMLDVAWHEDSCRILNDNGQKVLNSLRKLANLAHKRFVDKLPRKKSVKSNVLSALLDDNLAFDIFRMF